MEGVRSTFFRVGRPAVAGFREDAFVFSGAFGLSLRAEVAGGFALALLAPTTGRLTGPALDDDGRLGLGGILVSQVRQQQIAAFSSNGQENDQSCACCCATRRSGKAYVNRHRIVRNVMKGRVDWVQVVTGL